MANKWAWRTQILLTLVVLIEGIIFAVPGYSYPWFSAFIRPIFLAVLFREMRDYAF